MTILFSNAFPSQDNAPGLVSYRNSGGIVKVATFVLETDNGTSFTSSSRLNLFLLPFGARIIFGSVQSPGLGTNGLFTLVAIDGSPETQLWTFGNMNFTTSNLFLIERPARGMLYTAPSEPPSSILANGGVRIALAPTGSGTLPDSSVNGFFLYV